MAGIVHAAVIRTRFFDDFLIDSCAAGGRQVVLVGAGLDTRAYRLPWPDGVVLYEIDLPAVLTFKDQVLSNTDAVPRCRRVPVAADLCAGWEASLGTAGFRSAAPAIWLLEGLMIYLTADEATTRLEAVTDLSAGSSRLACGLPTTRSPMVESTPRLGRFVEMWKGGLGRRLPSWLTGHGWRVGVEDRDAVADAYGRPAPVPSDGGYLVSERVRPST